MILEMEVKMKYSFLKNKEEINIQTNLCLPII